MKQQEINTGETKRWSDEAWQAAAPVYEAITRLPFVEELSKGTLPMEKFIFYLEQDALYIQNYCRVLSSIASRVADPEFTEAFLAFAQDGVAVEKAMHEVYLRQYGGKVTPPTPTCLLYMNTLSAQATMPVEVQAASILPCFWVYFEVGKRIAATASKENPFRDWIDTYSYPEFETSNQRAIDICDALAAQASPEIRKKMTDIFVLATKMEWLFWHSAYELEQWKI